METFGLRRTQSLKNLSGVQNKSWVTPLHGCWNRKSVFQLVQHYQSYADLRSTEKGENKFKDSESCVTRENVAFWESGSSYLLSRSLSMDFVPEREPSCIRALCALFESKATLQPSFHSSPQLTLMVKTERDCHQQDWRSHNTSLKKNTIQRISQMERGKVTNGMLWDDNRTSSRAQVRDRSLLYLPRTEATDSTSASTQPPFIVIPGTKSKTNEMADAAKKVTISHFCHEGDGLPTPPPPIPPRLFDFEGPEAIIRLPVPPPKENFSTSYQQRQKNELKRLLKHIHPDLQAALDSAMDDEIMKAVQSENTHIPCQSEVQSMRWIFENWNLGNIGHLHETKKLMDDRELKGANVRGTTYIFDDKGDVRTSAWLFETQPLDSHNKSKTEESEPVEAVLKEPIQPGDVRKTRLLFESYLGPCDFKEDHSFLKLKSELQEHKGSVQKTVKLFEADSCCAIRDNSGNMYKIKSICKEEINSSNVSNARWLFETQTLDMINKETDEVKVVRGISLEEVNKGGVNQKRWMFHTMQEVEESDMFEARATDCKGETDVINKRKLLVDPLTGLNGDSSQKYLENKGIIGGDVKTSLWLFETQCLETLSNSYDVKKMSTDQPAAENLFVTLLYALMDSSGNLHKVISVSREELIKGKVQNYTWMFETKPLETFINGNGNVQLIKGITRQEDTVGEVKIAKWLFEAQTIEGIHSKSNHTKQCTSAEEPCKGDVKSSKWLFEVQKTDILYDKSETVKDKEAIDHTNMKSITWFFKTQPSDSIKEGEEYTLKPSNTTDNSVTSETGVQTIRHLFETEILDRQRKDKITEQGVKYVSQVNFQSGDVSRIKELFESQSFHEVGSEFKSNEQHQDEHIEKGSVHKFTWMFENCPINLIKKSNKDANIQSISSAESEVQNKKFIFETFSLDKIQPLEQNVASVAQPVSNSDVKTMMFEPLPLYAIKDNEGQIHEVTTVKKEEVIKGDVNGARWMFETKALDAIQAENDIYVIRAVTQEDIKKGDVKSARWKFETPSLEPLTRRGEPSVRLTEDFRKSNVQLNKHIFETEQVCQTFVQMVSVTDVQQGDVRTSTWLFENQAIDSLKTDSQGQRTIAVHREDNQKGDVKRCTWLFESQPLDKINNDFKQSVKDEIPKADVKRTTWLFETTPLDRITAYSVADALLYLYQMCFVHSNGIIIERSDDKNLHMAKYLLQSNEDLEIQKEEVAEGNIRKVVLELLLKSTLKPQVTLLREVEKGNITTTVIEFPVYPSVTTMNLESDQRIQNIIQVIDEMLVQDIHMRKGVIMQETEGVQAEMSVYSLICNYQTNTESQVIEMGDIKSMKGSLFATTGSQRTTALSIVDENERGNVTLSKSCIEKSDLHKLNNLHTEVSDDTLHSHPSKRQIEIVQGGVMEAKRSLYQQKYPVQQADVKNAKKEEIIPGDVLTAIQQLAVKQPILVEKEEIVGGDIKTTMKSLEHARQQSICLERDIITPGTIYDMNLSGHCSETEGSQVRKQIIVSGDVRAPKKSLEMAQQQNLQREVIVPGKIYNLNLSTQEEAPLQLCNQGYFKVTSERHPSITKESPRPNPIGNRHPPSSKSLHPLPQIKHTAGADASFTPKATIAKF